ncbi:hypothetical protein cand_030160 [Cryptosporidium andersoni]|uniref:Activator of Hsp90 ATPase AHSA1-like N-terminal domain-containing protein n=1 Tax=Cryptosporidium andersoni TaxID=117008 RepID=A0A1J4MQQ4_9CRYT|nr:hypothetical protein cand_030160 [Cryptosporidium andersoni]
MSEAVGSIWNANNWHWEEKKYDKWGKEKLKSMIEAFEYKFPPPNENLVIYLSCTKISGEASVSVRKKRPILAYEFEIIANWLARYNDNNDKYLTGSLTIPEFSVDNYQELYPIKISSSSDLGEMSNLVVKEMNNSLVNELRSNLKRFHDLLLETESNRLRLIADNEKREQEIKTAQIAQAIKGEEKSEIYRKQIEEEKQRQKSSNENISNVQGSLWNTGSWHWEERPETNWVKETFKQRIESLQIRIDSLNTIIEFSGVSVTGEASSSVRKGKKICVLDCSITCNFKAYVTLEQNSDKKFYLTGLISVSELNMIDTDEYTVKIIFDSCPLGISITEIPDFMKIKLSVEDNIYKSLDNLIKTFIDDFVKK